jgi:immunity protein 27 of polymorphic toxin system
MANPMRELAAEETDLRGDWVVQADRSVVADPTEKRIEWLTKHRLERIAKDASGWETLYRDPTDGRLWELTYPQSQMHGGGPRRLHLVTRDQAAAKYEHPAI